MSSNITNFIKELNDASSDLNESGAEAARMRRG